MSRHLARTIALQSLYEWDFRREESDAESVSIEDIVADKLEEFGDGVNEKEKAFVRSLVDGVLEHQDKIDKVITEAAPEWPLDQITTVDRNVLRLGLFELLFGDREEVPPKVAINEAIELAKGFGGESSGRFINGVMGSVYREIGEPGKDQGEPRKGKREHNNE